MDRQFRQFKQKWVRPEFKVIQELDPASANAICYIKFINGWENKYVMTNRTFTQFVRETGEWSYFVEIDRTWDLHEDDYAPESIVV